MNRLKQYIFLGVVLGLLLVGNPSQSRASGYIAAGHRNGEAAIANPAMGSGNISSSDRVGQPGSSIHSAEQYGSGALTASISSIDSTGLFGSGAFAGFLNAMITGFLP